MRAVRPLLLTALTPGLAVAAPPTAPTLSAEIPKAQPAPPALDALTARWGDATGGEIIEVAQRRRRRRRPAARRGGIDDSDLANEETLEELKEEEYDKESWSMGTAIGLSFIPGGGAGLLYAEKPAAATVPYLLSAIGYGIGVAYIAGVADESSSDICTHVRDGRVPLEECGFGDAGADPAVRNSRDQRGEPSSGIFPTYGQTQGEYTNGTVGEDFDGQKTGIIIIAGTYAVTTLLGAVWAASAVSDHNDRVRKKIDSTVQAPRPIVAYDGRRGFFGLAIDF